MKVVVTGGAGFIGSHIVDAYIAEGHDVFVVDDLSTGEKRNVNQKATLHCMDILDPGIPRLLARISPDVLNHHAAQMDLRRSVADPLFDARVNILGVIHLMEGLKDAGIKKVIFASSGGAVYGEQEIFPAPENHPARPASPYGVSKLAGECYLDYYRRTFGIPYVALRYSNVYGPRQLATGEAGVIAIFIRHLLKGTPPTIHGDGKQSRDFIYVQDVVAANLAALDSPVLGPVNIGTGCETDLLTLYDMLAPRIAPGIKAIHGPPKTGEQKRSSLDCSHARQALSWAPRRTLSVGLNETIAHYRR